LGVYVGQGLGFDAVHAGGCLVFALVMGPALIRSIQRFARRLQVTWVPVGAGVVGPPGPSAGAAPKNPARKRRPARRGWRASGMNLQNVPNQDSPPRFGAKEGLCDPDGS
jgi:hypothetical protein